MRYLFYDVETPNRCQDSICACAWLLHNGVKEISHGCQLINPQAPFDPFNISIHHITADDVSDAPTFSEYWNNVLKELFCSSIVVAHSAHFDISVTSKALNTAGIKMPRIKYIDTLPVIRSLLPDQKSYKLTKIASKYNICYSAHDASEDVFALAAVLEQLMAEKGADNLDALFEMSDSVLASSAKKKELPYDPDNSPYERYQKFIESVISSAKEKNVDLTNINFSFHGEFQYVPLYRGEGLDILLESLGGKQIRAVSGNTDYFVMLEQTEGTYVTKAMQIAAKPHSHIQIITEDDFLDILGYLTDNPNHDGPQAIRDRKKAELQAAEEARIAADKERIAKVEAREARKAARELEKATRTDKRLIGRPVCQFDTSGNLLHIFDTISSAASTIGISTKVIRDAAAGKQRTAGGFVWKYKDSEETED